MCKCFILQFAPCFVATARAVLLSALACTKNDSPISCRMACAKIKSADGAHGAYNSDSPLDMATVHQSLTLARHEKLVNIDHCTISVFSRRWVSSPVSVGVSTWLFFNSLHKSLAFNAGIVR